MTMLLAGWLLLSTEIASANASDPVLDALAAEATQAVQVLKASRDSPLYYLSYRVQDGTSYDLGASYGALTSRVPDDGSIERVRLLDVSTRVGSPSLDSTHKIRGGRFDFDPADFLMSESQQLPLEDDPVALRLALWKATNRSYEQAVKRLIKVRTNKEVKVTEEDDSGDFTTEPPQVSIGPSQGLTLDEKTWADRLRRLSGLFKTHPKILRSRVWLSGSTSTNYFVDTDGARIREPRSFFRVMILASTKADDGMDLDLYRDFEAVTPEQLPKEADLAAAVSELAAQLEALRVAPVINPYAGPAIIQSRAAAVFFHEIFGHRMEGHRQKDADEGHTFTHKVGELVLPTFLSVVDDPTRDNVANTWLNGHYQFDDEGVPARPAILVDHGVLKGFLMERSPIHGFSRSNGHGRAQAGLPVVARQGNLIVTSTVRLPFAELRKRLIAEIKRQQKPFGLIFDNISGGFTFTQADMLPQAFKVLPLVVKRVYPDGRPDELVRGVDLIGTPLQSFEKILATGDDPDVFNGYCGAESGFVPVAAVSPSLLVGEMEVDRRMPDHDRLPLLPPPLSAPASSSGAR